MPDDPMTPADEMSFPAVCWSCRTLHDAGKVEVAARYTDCSCWRCPNCGLLLDDRPPLWGGTPTGDEARRMARQGTSVIPPGNGGA